MRSRMHERSAAEYWCPPVATAVLDELAELDRQTGDGAESRPGHVIVVGAAGTGKTSFLTEFTRRARSRQLHVATGTRPVPVITGTDPRFRVLDDASQLDPDLITQLTADVDNGWGLVLAIHPDEGRDALSSLTALLPQPHVVELAPWTVSEVAEFLEVAAVPEHRDRPSADQLHRATAGFPWLVTRLAVGNPLETATAVRDRLRRLSSTARHLVEELAVGVDVDTCPAAEEDPDQFDDLLAELEANSLITPVGEIPPAVAEIASLDLPLHRRRRLQRRALDLLSSGTPNPEVLRRLADTGLRSPVLADALVTVGDAAAGHDGHEALDWYSRAERAGADAEPLAIRRADAARRSGDLTTAVDLTDAALVLGEPSDPDRTARVATAVFTQAGLAARAAEVCRWLGPLLSLHEANSAAVLLLSHGDRDGADRLIADRPASVAPTLRDAASTLLTTALERSLGPNPMDAVPLAARAAGTRSADLHDDFLPEHPAAVAALIALHVGDLATADMVLSPAVEALDPASRWYPRLALLTAWTRMMADDLDAAQQWRRAAHSTRSLASRDMFWDVSLGVGLARRGDDANGLAVEWARAHEPLLNHSVDLFDVLALGELHVTAVRVHAAPRVAPTLRAAWAILEELGSPPLWSTTLHWSVIQGAILANRPPDIRPHAEALVRAAQSFPLAATLASAGRTWVRVMAQDIDVDEVVRTAQRLRDTGRAWEGRRLAGHAAARADDRRDTTRLLECARDLGGRPSGAASSDKYRVMLPYGPSHLSHRERQVAELVIEGRTYREIGAALFLSERTIEHHVARIRRRFGATGRTQLLEFLASALRQLPPEK